MKTAAEKKRDLCIWCGRFVPLAANGCLKYHRCAGGGKCDGSGRPSEIKGKGNGK